MEPILHADIAALNGALTHVQITAKAEDLAAMRMLCQSRDMNDVWKYGITPFTFATLTESAAASFNHPELPLGYERGTTGSMLARGRKPESVALKRDIEAAYRLIDPTKNEFGSFEIDFSDSPAMGCQRKVPEYHIDSRTDFETIADKPHNNRVLILINGADDDLNTICMKSKSRRVAEALEKPSYWKEMDKVQRFNEAFEAQVADIVTPYQLPNNSITAILYNFDIHRAAINLTTKNRQRSFAALIF